jgi:hypothetical protein
VKSSTPMPHREGAVKPPSVTDRSSGLAPDRRPASTSTSWRPTRKLELREWVAVGSRIGAVGRGIQWMLGDWISYGTAMFGEKYSRAARITGYDVQSLMNMVYVSSRFPVSRRRDNLSWSHHEAVAAYAEDDQNDWLDKAIEQRWSVADMRMMLRTARRTRESGDVAGAGGSGAPDRVVAPPGHGAELAGRAIILCPRCGGEVEVAANGTP